MLARHPFYDPEYRIGRNLGHNIIMHSTAAELLRGLVKREPVKEYPGFVLDFIKEWRQQHLEDHRVYELFDDYTKWVERKNSKS